MIPVSKIDFLYPFQLPSFQVQSGSFLQSTYLGNLSLQTCALSRPIQYQTFKATTTNRVFIKVCDNYCLYRFNLIKLVVKSLKVSKAGIQIFVQRNDQFLEIAVFGGAPD